MDSGSHLLLAVLRVGKGDLVKRRQKGSLLLWGVMMWKREDKVPGILEPQIGK
jgi:hypothetical protein